MKENQPQVEILMATYNGEEYIEEQIRSIQAQTYRNWRLLVSDDSSTDKTIEILEHLRENDSRISILPTLKKYGGAKENFFHLIHESTGKYVMFADQDDYWLPSKVAATMDRLQTIEQRESREVPILVFSDSLIANQELKTINNSFFDNEGFPHDAGSLAHVLVENNVQGCTSAANRALINLAKSTVEPSDIIMHDWWLNLIAHSCGRTSLLDSPTMKYRQHDNNVAGAHAFSVFELIKSFNLEKSQGYWTNVLNQAKKLNEIYINRMPPENKKTIEKFISLFERNRALRVFGSYTGRYLPSGIARKAGQFGVFVLSPKSNFIRKDENE